MMCLVSLGRDRDGVLEVAAEERTPIADAEVAGPLRSVVLQMREAAQQVAFERLGLVVDE